MGENDDKAADLVWRDAAAPANSLWLNEVHGTYDSLKRELERKAGAVKGELAPKFRLPRRRGSVD